MCCVYRYYYEANSGLQLQSALYSSVSPTIGDSNATLVLDPNAMSSDGSVSVSGYTFSFDGTLMAYRVSRHEPIARRSSCAGMPHVMVFALQCTGGSLPGTQRTCETRGLALPGVHIASDIYMLRI